MELKKLVIHELFKESESKDVTLDFSDNIIEIDNNSIGFVKALSAAYQSDKILYAIFDDSEGKYFPEKFNEYRNSDRNEEEFVSFSRNVLGNLEALISPVTFATGGYFIFAEYLDNGRNFVGVFLIRDTEGKTLKKTDHSYQIQTIEYVDTKNLAMACRINEDRMDEDGINYLSFTQVKQQSVSEYFKTWVSIKQLESSRDYTKALYKIIEQIEPPIDQETGLEYSIQEFRNLVYNYAKSSPNKTISVRDMGQHFYQYPEKIIKFSEENDIIIDAEFRYNNTELNKFIKLEVNKDGIALKISRGSINQKVRLSEDDPNIVIIESESFANAFKRKTEE